MTVPDLVLFLGAAGIENHLCSLHAESALKTLNCQCRLRLRKQENVHLKMSKMRVGDRILNLFLTKTPKEEWREGIRKWVIVTSRSSLQIQLNIKTLNTGLALTRSETVLVHLITQDLSIQVPKFIVLWLITSLAVGYSCLCLVADTDQQPLMSSRIFQGSLRLLGTIYFDKEKQ